MLAEGVRDRIRVRRDTVRGLFVLIRIATAARRDILHNAVVRLTTTPRKGGVPIRFRSRRRHVVGITVLVVLEPRVDWTGSLSQ